MLLEQLPERTAAYLSLTINDRIVFASCLAQDQNERILWGQEAYDSQQGPVYKWLKLFLYDPDHPILQEPDAPKLPEGSLPEKLVTLYLRQVYDAITEMIRIHHSDCDQGTDYWFGWPATWSDESQQKMMRAVQEAGYGNDSDRVFFLTEAEAVALFFTQHEKLGKVSARPRQAPFPSPQVAFQLIDSLLSWAMAVF